MTTEEMKRAAALAAAELVENGMRVGLGSGSTAREFVRALGLRVASGLSIDAVASSQATAELAIQVGVPLVEHDGPLDFAVDGADALDRETLAAIKGRGGALTRERIVAVEAARFVLIVDEAKLFDRLDDALAHIPIPVAVVPFGWQGTAARLSRFGKPVLRLDAAGKPFRTDDGNFILDLHADMQTAPAWAICVKGLTGVVDHGLFLNLASLALVGTTDGVEVLKRETASAA